MSAMFDSFVRAVLDAGLDKAGHATCFVWWAEHHDGKPALSLDEICSYFSRARLVRPNRTRLDQDLRKKGYATRDKLGFYSLTQSSLEVGNRLFAAFLPAEKTSDLLSAVEIRKCPYIADTDIADARQMASVYVTLFCLENSLRRHIARVLSSNLGDSWWDVAASASMKRKEQDRLANEDQNRWIPSRSSLGPLYSVDWTDLTTLIRKYESWFKESIPDINFLYRFSDLGNLRNVVAHNGVIAEEMQFRRVELAFHDWIKQVGI